jgi:hypothetical protein
VHTPLQAHDRERALASRIELAEAEKVDRPALLHPEIDAAGAGGRGGDWGWQKAATRVQTIWKSAAVAPRLVGRRRCTAAPLAKARPAPVDGVVGRREVDDGPARRQC